MALKIALITIHWANNYGASLQVFATVKALGEFGEVSVMDYRNNYINKGMTWIRFGYKPRDVLRIGKDLLRLLPRYRVIKKFENFSYQYLNLSSRLNHTDAFKKVANEFDIFVTGSDQVWNPKIVSEYNKLDTRYFLDFVHGKKKFSYASSIGAHKYNDVEKSIVKNLLDDYCCIAVREKDSSQYLSELLNRQVEHVLDPTLLYNKRQWLEFFNISENKPDKPYILVYALKNDLLLKQIVEQLSETLRYEVITINQEPFTNYKCDKHVKDAGPVEFLKLFANASFVITNSFHGTCFSVNFNIPFAIASPHVGAIRIENFLSSVGVQDRIISNEQQILEAISNKLDFNRINRKLKILVDDSKKYIENACKY